MAQQQAFATQIEIDTQWIFTYNMSMLRTMIALALVVTVSGCGHLELVNNRDGSVHAYIAAQ